MIISVKNNKGGVGKTFLAVQIASGLALADKKVLILTSDSQNNVLNYTTDVEYQKKHGIKEEVLYKNGDYIRLRENLFFLPLEDNHFGSKFLNDLPKFLKEKTKEYDFILIDSVPTLKIDKVFLENSDKIIIPTIADEVTTESIVNLLETIDIKKVLSIIINKYKNTKIQKQYKEILKNYLKDTNIIYPSPIKDRSFVEQILDNKKTVWEYNNKESREIQDILYEIIIKLT